MIALIKSPARGLAFNRSYFAEPETSEKPNW